MDLPEIVISLINDFSEQPQVDAILLGGSRATDKSDEKSDYDIYIYVNSELPIEVRRGLLEQKCELLELDNRYWETEDNGILNGQFLFDFVYRGLGWIEEHLTSVLNKGQASTGYSTCVWYNFLTSMILFDRDGYASDLQKKFNVEYPEILRKNIIKKNRELLSGKIPSYDNQIVKAVQRGDVVSIQHRVTAFLESYFDILYAFNRLPHPGEKRMVENLIKPPKNIPDNMCEDIEALLQAVSAEEFCVILERIVQKVDILLEND